MPNETGRALRMIAEEEGGAQALELVGSIMEFNARATAHSYEQLLECWEQQNEEIADLRAKLRSAEYKISVAEEFFALFMPASFYGIDS